MTILIYRLATTVSEMDKDSGDQSPEFELVLEGEEDSLDPAEAPKTAPSAPEASQVETPVAGLALELEDSGKTEAPSSESSKPAWPEMAVGDYRPSVMPESPGVPASTPPEPQITYYEDSDQAKDFSKLLVSTIVCGVIGALCFATIMCFYYAVGRRVGILFIAFFAALGARLGTENLYGQKVRWVAALCAGGSAFLGKILLVMFLLVSYRDFDAEDWMNFVDPGRSAAIYTEQAFINAFAAGGRDTRTGQERLDERFENEFRGSEEGERDIDLDFREGLSNLYDGDRYEYEDDSADLEPANLVKVPPKKLGFWDILPRVFDIFDLPLTLLVMFGAARFARTENF